MCGWGPIQSKHTLNVRKKSSRPRMATGSRPGSATANREATSFLASGYEPPPHAPAACLQLRYPPALHRGIRTGHHGTLEPRSARWSCSILNRRVLGSRRFGFPPLSRRRREGGADRERLERRSEPPRQKYHSSSGAGRRQRRNRSKPSWRARVPASAAESPSAMKRVFVHATHLPRWCPSSSSTAREKIRTPSPPVVCVFMADTTVLREAPTHHGSRRFQDRRLE